MKRLFPLLLLLCFLSSCQTRLGEGGVVLECFSLSAERIDSWLRTSDSGMAIDVIDDGYGVLKSTALEDEDMKSQIRSYLEAGGLEFSAGGPNLKYYFYSTEPCVGIVVTASTPMLGRAAGEDLSDLFRIETGEDVFLFSADRKLIGRLSGDKAISVPEYLALKPLFLPAFSLITDGKPELTSETSFTVRVQFEGDKELVCVTSRR